MEGYIEPPKQAPLLGRQHWDISVKKLERDSDGDGWTDIEERRLKLNPQERDSDGDGSPDGEDICPNYAPQGNDSANEDVQILQKVFFAVFGLSGSRGLLLINRESRRFQAWGYGGPVLYVDDQRAWRREHPEGGVFLSWNVKDRSKSAATVTLTDDEGPLAGSGRTFHMRKINGHWFVTTEDSMRVISQRLLRRPNADT